MLEDESLPPELAELVKQVAEGGLERINRSALVKCLLRAVVDDDNRRKIFDRALADGSEASQAVLDAYADSPKAVDVLQKVPQQNFARFIDGYRNDERRTANNAEAPVPDPLPTLDKLSESELADLFNRMQSQRWWLSAKPDDLVRLVDLGIEKGYDDIAERLLKSIFTPPDGPRHRRYQESLTQGNSQWSAVLEALSTRPELQTFLRRYGEPKTLKYLAERQPSDSR